MSRLYTFAYWQALAIVALAAAPGTQAEDWADSSDSVCCCGTLLMWCGQTEPGGPPGMDEPLASDRPDFTEASSTVGRGVVQLEMGYTLFADDGGGVRTRSHSYPELLARIGVLADWFELRVAWNYATLNESFDPVTRSVSGSEDLYLGSKLMLTSQYGIWPEMALVPQMTVPTGHRDFTADKVLAGVNWLYGWDVLEWLSFAGSTQGNMSIDEVGDDYFEFAQSFTFGYSLTEKLGAYTEWFMLAPAGATAARTEHYLDGGFTYKVTNNLQLDIRAGLGLSEASDDYFVGSGLVVRF
jgi:hypothetical protein